MGLNSKQFRNFAAESHEVYRAPLTLFIKY